MTEGATRVSVTKNWADEIDDLHLDATEKRLQAVYLTRTRSRFGNAAATDEPQPSGGLLQRGAPAGDIAH